MGKGRPVRKADNHTAICEPIVWKMWELPRPTTLWAFTACYRYSSTFFTFALSIIYQIDDIEDVSYFYL
jgi:hypothetical protein